MATRSWGVAASLTLALSLLAANGCDYSSETRRRTPPDLLVTGEVHYSQFREEIFIRHFFDDRRDGTFVDVGAWMPLKNSTTAYLELKLGWKGVAIDPAPGLAGRWAKERPNSKFVPYIVNDKGGGTETLYLGYGTSSVDPDHADVSEETRDRAPKTVEVETITLNKLLMKQGISKVDFMSMDIEGSEPQALAGFDIQSYRPELVCIEAGRPDTERRRLIAEYFEKNGYERIREYESPLDPNWYLRPKS